MVVDIDAPPLSQIDNFQAVLTGPGPIGPISVTSAQSFAAITGLYSIAISGSIPLGTINAQMPGILTSFPFPARLSSSAQRSPALAGCGGVVTAGCRRPPRPETSCRSWWMETSLALCWARRVSGQ